MVKTNAMRILDGLGIQYEVLEYEDNTGRGLPRCAAARTAEKLGVPPETVFKTIVMRSDRNGIFVFCQSAAEEISLKKARAAAGCGELSPVRPDELPALTGYVRGGCSPLGMRRQFPTYIDELATLHEKICVSGGRRGAEERFAPGMPFRKVRN